MPDKTDVPRNPFNAVFLIFSYIAMLIVPYLAMYYNAQPPPTAPAAVECKWSWKHVNCQPASQCRFQLGAGCMKA